MQSRLSGLFIYPLKGGAGLALPWVSLDQLGPELDRRWMAVDVDGRAITQRDAPALARIRPAIQGDAVVLHADAAAPLDLSARGRRVPVTIWRDRVDAIDLGDETAAWISAAIGARGARLVHIPVEHERQVDLRFGRSGDRVGFADAFPLLLISQAALDELNRRLAEPLPMNRFRPNLVVDGVPPHAEDGWSRITIGDVPFDVVKPCARCVVTTIDQERAVAGTEPLRTLATYRRAAGGVFFGQNLIHRAAGTLHVGDPVRILEERARRMPDIPAPIGAGG